ncbi:DUF2865 domain-containing protein [Ensifer soli]|uniref:DUF2865 domain-containing protein n=1 Tax=Ciceribacter sp. sgz301302 TaxID=3342379 RepID=UPI0035B8645C
MTGIALRMAILAGALVALAGTAKAETCRGVGLDGASQALVRQIAAIRASSARRGCTGAEDGLFSACRDINRRLAAAERALSAVSPAADCAAVASAQTPKRGPGDGVPAARGKIQTMCVRLSDGYYFPSPNSGYGSARDETLIAAQCRLICDTQDMEVFRVDGIDRTSESMTSLATGRRYADLPTAGAYRAASPVKRCDTARYYRQAAEIIARSTKERRKEPAVTSEAEADLAASAPAIDATVTTGGLMQTALRGRLDVPRKVRLVGPSFFPAE